MFLCISQHRAQYSGTSIRYFKTVLMFGLIGLLELPDGLVLFEGTSNVTPYGRFKKFTN